MLALYYCIRLMLLYPVLFIPVCFSVWAGEEKSRFRRSFGPHVQHLLCPCCFRMAGSGCRLYVSRFCELFLSALLFFVRHVLVATRFGAHAVPHPRGLLLGSRAWVHGAGLPRTLAGFHGGLLWEGATPCSGLEGFVS